MDAAVLELGTREFRLLHARIDAGGRLQVITEAVERVGIDASLDATGHIGRRSWADGLRAFGRLSTAARRWSRSGEVLALAPHSFCSAPEAGSFVLAARVRHRLGIDVLSATECAHLVYAGVKHELGLAEEPVLVAHLGDATIDLVAGSGDRCVAHGSLGLGVARLNRAFAGADGALLPEDGAALFSLVRLCGGPAGRGLAGTESRRLVVSSDYAVAVSDIARAWGYLDSGSAVLGRLALHALVGEAVAATPASLCRLGIPPERAALVGTATILVDALADLLGQREVAFASSGVRHGAAIRWLSAGRTSERARDAENFTEDTGRSRPCNRPAATLQRLP
jgi:exopolyphosphatase/pppGpp-phosphohydrolase